MVRVHNDDLSSEQKHILDKKGTEQPGSAWCIDHTESGVYTCAGCGADLFGSSSKFASGCGWPAFDDVINNENVTVHDDNSHGMYRQEVRCASCDGHLGHVFPDGPKETTGLRYCINGAILGFRGKEDDADLSVGV